MAETVRYNLAQMMFNDLEIVADSFKTTIKMDAEELTATNSSNPYDVQYGKESLEWEASDIDPALRKDVQTIYDQQKIDPSSKGTIATYDFNELTGDLVPDDIFYGAYITEISKENGNQPFSVKGGALKRKI
jgi:hypothetical protein